MAEPLLTVVEAAKRLKVSPATVRRHVPLVRIGGCIRVDPAALEEYILSQQSGGKMESTMKGTTIPRGRTAPIAAHRGWTDTELRLAARLGIDLDNPQAPRKRNPKK